MSIYPKILFKKRAPLKHARPLSKLRSQSKSPARDAVNLKRKRVFPRIEKLNPAENVRAEIEAKAAMIAAAKTAAVTTDLVKRPMRQEAKPQKDRATPRKSRVTASPAVISRAMTGLVLISLVLISLVLIDRKAIVLHVKRAGAAIAIHLSAAAKRQAARGQITRPINPAEKNPAESPAQTAKLRTKRLTPNSIAANLAVRARQHQTAQNLLNVMANARTKAAVKAPIKDMADQAENHPTAKGQALNSHIKKPPSISSKGAFLCLMFKPNYWHTYI